MSVVISCHGEDNNGFPQIVPSSFGVSGDFSPLGRKRNRSCSLESVFADDFEEPQLKRKVIEADAYFPFADLDLYTPPGSAASSASRSELDSGTYSDLDLDIASVDFADFDSIGTCSLQQGEHQRQSTRPAAALDIPASQLYPTLQLGAGQQQQQRRQPTAMHATGSTTQADVASSNQEPRLVIVEEPEEYYRARYESEGVRAPLKGVRDNHPTVKVVGPYQYGGRVDVQLVYEDGSRHTSCSLDLSEDRKNALTKKIGPHNNMTATFEDLRIRREIRSKKKPETSGGKKQLPDKVTAARLDGRNDKVAHLCFTATLDVGGSNKLELSVISRPITLTTPPDPAELDWIRPETGHFHGGDEIVIKGSKMTSPKVTFQISVPNPSGNAPYDLTAVVEKDKSHQNVLLVKTPPLPPALVNCMQPKQPICAMVTVSTGRSLKQSNPLPFWFIPDEICNKCMQRVQQQATVSSPLSSIPMAASPPTTPSITMDKPAPVPMGTAPGIPVMKIHPSRAHFGVSKSFPVSMVGMQLHHELKQEMPPPSFPPSHFPHHQLGRAIGMDSSINPLQFGMQGMMTHSSSAPNIQHHETKLNMAGPAHSGSHTHVTVEQSTDPVPDIMTLLMPQSDEDNSTSSPEPDDDFPSDLRTDFDTCPNLSPFTVPAQPACTRAVTSPYFSQLSPTSVSSPLGSSTPPCYSPITPVTSPQHQGVHITSANIGLFCDTLTPGAGGHGLPSAGGHSLLALSQPNLNHK